MTGDLTPPDILITTMSREGNWRIRRATDILMRYRESTTPVGIVTNAMQKGEKVQINTLGEMLSQEISMQTTIMVGNSETFVFEGRLITSRGHKASLGY